MQALKIFCAAGVIWMTAAILYGFIVGDFFAEAKALFPYPWFQVSMVDLYTGFALFSGWVIFRESSTGKTIAWIIAFMLLGNPATCLYALLAAINSKGDWQQFWVGARNPAATNAASGMSQRM